MIDIIISVLLYGFILSCVLRHILGTLLRLSEYREKAVKSRFKGQIR